MKKSVLKITAVFMMLALVVVSMAGCGEVNKYKEEAVAKIETMGEKMTAVQNAMTGFDGSEATLEAITTAVAECKTSCQEIADLQAPEKIAKEHGMLSDAMKSIIGAMDIYAEVFSSMESAQEALTGDKLEQAQSLMTQGANQLVEAATALDEVK